MPIVSQLLHAPINTHQLIPVIAVNISTTGYQQRMLLNGAYLIISCPPAAPATTLDVTGYKTMIVSHWYLIFHGIIITQQAITFMESLPVSSSTVLHIHMMFHSSTIINNPCYPIDTLSSSVVPAAPDPVIVDGHNKMESA